MPHRSNPRSRLFGAAVAVLAISGAGCSSNPADPPPPTIAPATAAESPPATGAPAGSVLPFGPDARAALFDAATRSLVILEPGPAVTVVTEGRPRTVRLPQPATALTAGADGTAYLATRGGYLRLDIAAGGVDRIEVDGEPDTDVTAIARRADGRVVLGTADGSVLTLDSDTAVGARVGGFARVDALVARGDTAIVLDRAQTSVSALDTDGTKVAQALRAGEGATTMAADAQGRILVADTRGDELLVFSTDPLIMRQRYPVYDAPYGLAGSPGLAWVSQTAANAVIGYDLSTGIPVERVRHRTVQQPNLLAYDDASGTLYVVSGTGAGVQVITGAAGPR